MKAIFLIALIACASAAGPSFLGNYIKQFEQVKNEFDTQFKAQLQLEQQAQDLSAAAAAGAAADPEAVVNTINGLSDAAKFWGSFVGNKVFDSENLSRKISELSHKREQLAKYASEDGTAAMVALNQAIWDINVCIKQIQSFAIQLKKGAKNVNMITSIAFKANKDMLEDRDKAIYEAAIKVLVNTLKSANDNAANTQEKLYILTSQLVSIETQMKAVSDRLKSTAKGKSREFENWRDDMRAKVYGGCAASILGGPLVFACYGTAAIVLETEIADYKRETEQFVSEFNDWASTFSSLSTMAQQAQTVSKTWYSKVTDFKNVIQNQYDLITGTQDILWMSHDMRQMISDSLEELITECDKVINDTTGRLEGEAQELNQKFSQQQTQEVDISTQVQTMCHQANPNNQEREIRCVKASLKKIQMM